VTEIYVHRFDLIKRQQIKSFEFMVKRKNQECIVTFYVGCHCYHQSYRRAVLETQLILVVTTTTWLV
jgi:hypothetical protein